MAAHPPVRVGVGALLVAPGGRVLVGVRKGVGAGTTALPGGHLEPGEALAHCAARETAEETGIDAQGWRPVAVENVVVGADGGASAGAAPAAGAGSALPLRSHYITVFMWCDLDTEPAARTLEPGACEGWAWVPWADLGARAHAPLFAPLAALVARGGGLADLERRV